MYLSSKIRRLALVTVAALALSACDSAEERAEAHFQSALALIEEGDTDRAIVELRNVFQLNGSHKQARETLADLMLERGNRQEAYSQYLRLAEQYPEDADTRISLTTIAFVAGHWEEVTRHGQKSVELAPEEPQVIAIAEALRYGEATRNKDETTRRDAARKAEQLLQDQPENLILRNLLIDSYLRDLDFGKALTALDEMLAREPENERLLLQRLSVLAEIGDTAALEKALYRLVEIFPDNITHKQTLIRYLMNNGKQADVEAFLRQLVSDAPEDDPGPRVQLIRFLAEIRGTEAARVEIDKAIADHPDPLPFIIIDAGLDFDDGQREEAVANLEAAIEGKEPSDRIQAVKVTLARMLLSMGNEVGARARVEEILAEDPAQPDALKLQAAWHIEADDAEAAISALRNALNSKPDDAQAMTMMAEAYTRAGSPQLARDFLALAVEASNNAPTETLRYARLLMREQRFLPAEDILISSLRLNKADPDLLIALGELYLLMEDNGRAQDVVQALRRLETEEATLAANAIEADRLSQESGLGDALAFLETVARGPEADITSQIVLIRARLATGDTSGAMTLAEELAASNPEDETAAFVLALTKSTNGQLEEAEQIYRGLLDEDPARPAIWLQMSRIQLSKGDRNAAYETIDEGLNQTPNDGNLNWAKASLLEQDGKVDEAIAVYESLYEQNSSALVVANNLASLIATYRDDEESLDRAWRIARRFSDTEVPALQDTYGWIIFRRGDAEEALPYLEGAARGLPEDPIVQYHLGRVYQSLSRPADALTQMQRAVEIAGPTDLRPQIEEARSLIVSLQSDLDAADGQ
ncbi:MAG: tetratricopeptide repeat protein [Rhodobacteraceae bacterium]|nr:tetratricopeptide repeat protein [Paracoccaceae bacterium]